MIPWWAWFITIQLLLFAIGYSWGVTHPRKCPPHDWQDVEGQLICSKCKRYPTMIRFRHYSGIL